MTCTFKTMQEERAEFERNKRIYQSAKLVFRGVEGYDVYNPSIPFCWQGEQYMFARVERRNEWARSWVRLFRLTRADEWTVVQDSMIHTLEDPYVACIAGELVMGGTHVQKVSGLISTYFGYFYRGNTPHDLRYFTTGPAYMKDIRLVELEDGRIGVFSRPRNEEILRSFGCESQIGFTTIDQLDDLTPEIIANAPYIPGLFAADEWGGCNQAYLLSDGMIGMIGHQCYKQSQPDGTELAVYLNIAFVFDRHKHRVVSRTIIGTRSCYPSGPAKRPDLADCAFTAGIVPREDGMVDLYSGIGDAEAGRLTIDNPFSAHGTIQTHIDIAPASRNLV